MSVRRASKLRPHGSDDRKTMADRADVTRGARRSNKAADLFGREVLLARPGTGAIVW
jgi:hypothetical protein